MPKTELEHDDVVTLIGLDTRLSRLVASGDPPQPDAVRLLQQGVVEDTRHQESETGTAEVLLNQLNARLRHAIGRTW